MLEDNGRRVKQHFNYHITTDELKIFFHYIRKHCHTQYEIACLLMCFRGMRTSEALAANVNDFNNEFTRITYREAKTNKLRMNEVVVKPIAERVKAYVEMNKFRLEDGWLFPYYKNKVRCIKGVERYYPHMDAHTFEQWFVVVRKRLAKDHACFNEKYPFTYKNGMVKWKYRISSYSFRRWFETTFYIGTGYNLALLKEIMLYSSKFDPIKHYIRIVHKDEQKADILENAFGTLANEMLLASPPQEAVSS
jgi:integrase